MTEEEAGTLKYTPFNGFEGDETFAYTIKDSGGSISEASVTIRVISPISLAITSPQEGELIRRSKVLVEGAVSHKSDAEVGIAVNGVPALIHGGRFIANEVPLDDEFPVITVQAIDSEGNSKSVSISVNIEVNADCVSIRAITYWGVSPYETTMIVSDATEDLSISYNGPGIIEYLPRINDTEYPVRITTEGIYHFTAEARNGQGEMCSSTIALIVPNKSDLDSQIQAKWNVMKSKLASGEIDEALNYFKEGSKEDYRKLFTALADRLPELVSEMQGIEMVTSGDDRAEYRINRIHIVEGEPVTIAYTIYFLLDEDGLWRLNRF